MTIHVIGCGGAGLNNIKRHMESGGFSGDMKYFGLDTSTRNIFESEHLTFEQVPETSGSGGKTDENADKYPEFCNRFITQHGIADVTIIVYSGSGGTGPSMGPTLHKALLDKEANVISLIIGDMSNVNGGTNTVRALLNLNDAVEETGWPVLYSYRENGKGRTEGEVNEDISLNIDCMAVLFSGKNGRIDERDIHHLFFYNKVVKATPVLSCLEFLSEAGVKDYHKNSVAALSLFDNEDNITTVFPGLLYSKAGIFNKEYLNPNYAQLHGVLDHGDSVKYLEEMLEKQRRSNAEANSAFKTVAAPVTVEGTKKGAFKQYDI